MNKDSKIYVAGGNTLFGAALLRQFKQQGYENIIGKPPAEPDLTDSRHVDMFFNENRPEYVFLAAGKTGGIKANQKYPADLMLNNLLIESHVMDCCHRYGVRKMLYLASSCCYPKNCSQPMHVNSLLTDLLEPTNEAYAIAKIAGIKLCEAYQQQYQSQFISVIPANGFGPNDDFSLANSQVIPALIHKTHEAKVNNQTSIRLWGTGTPQREFIYADDCADACIFLMNEYSDSTPINIGSLVSYTIRQLAEIISRVVGYKGEIQFDSSKPDGMLIKILDSTPLHELGWYAKHSFQTAVEKTYEWFIQNICEVHEKRYKEVRVKLP